MNKANGAVDERLQEVLVQLKTHYQITARQIDDLSLRLDGQQSAGTVNDELRLIMNRVETHQAKYVEASELWNSAGFQKSAGCIQLKAEVQDVLASLLNKIEAIESKTNAKKTRLLPQLNTAARKQQASAAYQRSGKGSH